jgi:hypothetical protein
MFLELILAASLSPLAAAAPAAPAPLAEKGVDRSLGETDRLKELEIDIRSAQERGEIDKPAAERFYLELARIRRQMILMGMQVGYRQRIRLRQRIDRLYARWEQRRAIGTSGRSGK